MPGGIALTPSLPIPIGGIAAWLKSYTNTPALPSGWVEMNGQVLNDSESVYNGQTLPNLNSGNRFLRGNAASGNTGGAETVTLNENQIPGHTHTIPLSIDSGENYNAPQIGTAGQGDAPFISGATGGNQAHENLPPYYNVVWIMRVK
jgi:microcystin-dependent protein